MRVTKLALEGGGDLFHEKAIFLFSCQKYISYELRIKFIVTIVKIHILRCHRKIEIVYIVKIYILRYHKKIKILFTYINLVAIEKSK